MEGKNTDRAQITEHAIAYKECFKDYPTKILDVGTGDGAPLRLALEWLNHHPELLVVTDFNWAVLNRFRTESLTVASDGKDLPFVDNSFSAVVASQVIEHLPGSEHLDFVRELVRVVEPGGKAVISTVNKEFPYNVRGHVDHKDEYDFVSIQKLRTDLQLIYPGARIDVVIADGNYLKAQKIRSIFWFLRPIKDAIPRQLLQGALTMLTGGKVTAQSDLQTDFKVCPLEDVLTNDPERPESREKVKDFIITIPKD